MWFLWGSFSARQRQHYNHKLIVDSDYNEREAIEKFVGDGRGKGGGA